MPVQTRAVSGASPLQDLVPALRALHQALLEESRVEYERTHGPVSGSGHLLHLLAHDEAFAWLRVLSSLMVDLDVLVEEQPPASDEETAAIRQELEETFSSAAPGGFWPRCSALLQSPPVVMAYAQVRAALARLPAQPPVSDAAERLHAQHRWALARRKRGVA
jgi:hypothetical protein